MGKNITIKAGYTRVTLPNGGTYDAGNTLVLSDADVLKLTAGMNRAITIGSTVADPIVVDDVFDTLTELGDVDDTGKADGNSLVFNGTTGKWRPLTPSSTGATIDDADTSSAAKVWSIAKVKSFFPVVDDAASTSAAKVWSIDKLKAFFPVLDDAASTSTVKSWSIDKLKAFFPVVNDAGTSSGAQVWSLNKVQAFFLARIGNTYSMVAPVTDRLADITIEDDASDSSTWVDRFRFQYKTGGVAKPVGWFNEYGELRGVSAKVNTVAARWFGKYNDADTAHDTATPVIEVVATRQTRTNRWKVMPDGSTVQSARAQIVMDAGTTMEMAIMYLAVGASLPGTMPSYPVLIVRF